MYPRAGETDPSLAYPPVPNNRRNTLSHNDTIHPRIQQNPHLQMYPRKVISRSPHFSHSNATLRALENDNDMILKLVSKIFT